MLGIEISRKYYNEYGYEMIHRVCPHIEKIIAVGLCGSGSECLGFDDEFSRDHDFEPGFCIFLPEEDIVSRKDAFLLEKEYYRLPKEYCGLRKSAVNPAGGSRRGIIRIGDFLEARTGSRTGELTLRQWMTIPEFYLVEITNGQLFRDDFGKFRKIRESLSSIPEDVRLKKLAGSLMMMDQSGQYNYSRCIDHGETAAAQMSLFEFAKNAMHAVFLLNGKLMPYYKWQFRAMRRLDILPQLAETLEFLISTENDERNAVVKEEIIEDVATLVTDEVKKQGITNAVCSELQKHAFSVNDMIRDPEIRNMNILSAV